MLRKLFTLFFILFTLHSTAQELKVKEYRYVGPIEVKQPVMMDSVNLKGMNYDAGTLLDIDVPLNQVRNGEIRNDVALPHSNSKALHLIGFSVNAQNYCNVSFTVKNLAKYALFVDGVKQGGGSIAMEPALHEVVVKYLADADSKDSLDITVKSDVDDAISLIAKNGKRSYTMRDVLTGWHFNGLSLAPNGKYGIVSYYTYHMNGSWVTYTQVMDMQTGKVIEQRNGAKWMPRSNKYYIPQSMPDGSQTLYAVDPVTHVQTVLAENLPSGSFEMSPTEDYLIYTFTDEGPKENKDVFEVVEPDDRQPGWRNRSRLSIYDMKTHTLQPLTFGHHSTTLNDISRDGKFLLVTKSESRLTQRPTTLNSLYRINVETLEVDTLVCRDGFLSGANFSPDGRQILLTGSPEAFGAIGNVVPEGRIPSMIDQQLYLMDLGTHRITPVTRDFNPNVQSVGWCPADGNIYFTAEDKDCMHLFRLLPKTRKIEIINVPEEMVSRFEFATAAPVLAFVGNSASNSDRLYTMNTRSLKSTCLDDLSATTLRDVELGECRPWTFVNTKGDSICCRYYLPPHFDSSKKYPMVVNYYGGCSPTSRNFESRYPQHLYAAQGYVVLVINPSGATGFGQEFSSRHVNTAGEGVAEDILGAVKDFCAKNAFVNDKKIGCIGASYGGFMTQYLQTKTDIFAAAISHAGISDHTSYWGEGYWGYSYSEVSMANSYPWTDRHLYVDQSPLFNADKIHTPLLFLHGTDDTNVPVGESIQMYTALKLLGRPTAMVLVEGQNHHITDYAKRIKWQNTIFAWFARYLKDDSTWWNAMYKEKNL